MSHATFECATVTISTGAGAQRAALSIYELGDGARCCWLDERADLQSLLWRLELSFRRTGGVPLTLDVRAARPFTKPKSGEWSVTFQRFCTHFGVRPVQAEGRRSSILTALIECTQARSYDSLTVCEQELRDQFPQRKTTEELQPLPVPPFVSDNSLFRRVAGDGFLLCRGDAYSVPDEYRGKTVWIQIRENRATIHSKEGRLLAQHPVGSGKGDVFLQESHFDRRQPRVPAALRRAFLAQFPQFTQFLASLLAQRGSDAARTLRVILELAPKYPSTLTRAIDSAVRYNNFSHRFIRGYMAVTTPSAPPPTSQKYEQGSLFDLG